MNPERISAKRSHSKHINKHIVLVRKYRCPVLRGGVQKRWRELIMQICGAEDIQILNLWVLMTNASRKSPGSQAGESSTADDAGRPSRLKNKSIPIFLDG
jgi:hypothetical protein